MAGVHTFSKLCLEENDRTMGETREGGLGATDHSNSDEPTLHCNDLDLHWSRAPYCWVALKSGQEEVQTVVSPGARLRLRSLDFGLHIKPGSHPDSQQGLPPCS